MNYILRRIFHTVGLFLAVSVFTFLLIAIAPGKPFDEMRMNPQISAETISAERARFSLDHSIAERYFVWAGHLLHGDPGFSFSYGANIGTFLWLRARNTLFLTSFATVISWLVAIPLGIWCAAADRKVIDRGVGFFTSLLVSLPEPFLVVFILYLAVRFKYSPLGGMTALGFDEFTMREKIVDLSRHLFLPALTLVLTILPILVRHVRASMYDVLRTPFIEAAQLSGVRPSRLLFRHALPAALNPLFAMLGFSVGYLLSVSLIVEIVMQWPGLGPLFLESIYSRDVLVVVDVVLLSTFFMLFGNLTADLLLYWNDPRIRAQ